MSRKMIRSRRKNRTMPYNLAALVRKQKPRTRRDIILRPRPVPRRLEGEALDIGLRVVRTWRQEMKTILAAYQTTDLNDASALITDDIAQIRRLLQGAESKAGQLLVAIDPLIQAWAIRVERWQRDGWERSISAGTGVDISGISEPLGNSQRVQTFRAWAVSLIKDLNAQLQRDVSNLVFAAVQNQTPRRKLAKDLAARLGISRRRAMTIARDQTTKLAATLDQARNEEAGITEYRWRHSGKKDFRKEHKAREGQIFQWNDPPSDGHPGQAINCGCTSEAVIRFDEDDD